jgi:hypothetical protein
MNLLPPHQKFGVLSSLTLAFLVASLAIFVSRVQEPTYLKSEASLTTESTIEEPVSFYNIKTGDFNNDRATDLVVGDTFANKVYVFLNDGYGYFKPAYSQEIFQPQGLYAYDFNRDGYDDLVRGNLMPPGGNQDSVIEFLVNETSSASASFKGFRSVQTLKGKPDPVSIKGADFNKDGYQDIVFVADSHPAFHLRYWDPQAGRFNEAGVDVILPKDLNDDLWDVAVADLDNDGDMDLTFANNGVMNNQYIFLNKGLGEFDLTNKITVVVPGEQQESVTVNTGDFNKDGRIDIATANKGANHVTIIYNYFPNFTVQKIDVGEITYGLDSTDLDRDGDIDLIATSLVSSSVIFFKNNGLGSFEIRKIPTSKPKATIIASGSFNRADKMPDVAVILERNENGRLFNVEVHPNLMWHKTDFDFNNLVNIVDIQTVAGRYQMTVGDDLYDRIYEVASKGADGIIDSDDVEATSSDWGWDGKVKPYSYPSSFILNPF